MPPCCHREPRGPVDHLTPPWPKGSATRSGPWKNVLGMPWAMRWPRAEHPAGRSAIRLGSWRPPSATAPRFAPPSTTTWDSPPGRGRLGPEPRRGGLQRHRGRRECKGLRPDHGHAGPGYALHARRPRAASTRTPRAAPSWPPAAPPSSPACAGTDFAAGVRTIGIPLDEQGHVRTVLNAAAIASFDPAAGAYTVDNGGATAIKLDPGMGFFANSPPARTASFHGAPADRIRTSTWGSVGTSSPRPETPESWAA